MPNLLTANRRDGGPEPDVAPDDDRVREIFKDHGEQQRDDSE
jgi:hypothetical protein